LSTLWDEQVCCETVVPTIPIIFHRTKAICSAYGQTGYFLQV